MEAVIKTDIGLIRQVNEDSVDVLTKGKIAMLALVADGMGGHQAGDVASTMALNKLKDKFEALEVESDVKVLEDWLLTSIQEANQYIYEYAQQNNALLGMGTTIVAALFMESYYIIAHVGDSRIYRYYQNKLEQLTNDHSLVYELLRSGQITKEEADNHPQRNVITRALGTEEQVEIDIKTLAYLEDELLLLCTDGLNNKVADGQIAEILATEDSLEGKANKLVELALQAGGEDNITLALIDVDSDRFDKK